MKAIYSENRKLRDADAPRAFFVRNPIWLDCKGLPSELKASEAPVHPDYPNRGVREITLTLTNGKVNIGIQETDFKRIDQGAIFRMKDLANFVLDKDKNASAKFHSLEVDEVRKIGGPIIHWVPKENSVSVEMIMVDGEKIEGFAEPSITTIPVGTFLQFERVGFARIYETGEIVRVAFSHK
jgi:hypothetical protein